MKFSPEIIHEDKNLVIVSKPSGLLSVPDRYNKLAPNLSDILKKKYNELFVVHRLDKETSGIMLYARDAASHRDLSIQFENHEIRKIYHALVSGYVEKDDTDVDIPIAAHPARKGVMIPSARGKESLSRIRVLERFRFATLIEVDLVTGRQHQLRVHCSAIGHPLLVDSVYGSNDSFNVSSIKRNFNLKKGTEEKPIMSRISMHALEIEFRHPVNNERLVFRSEYPKDFRASIQVLKKYSSI